MSTNGDFVSLQGVTKTFGELEVLHGIDLDVGEHQVICLIGASGSGKSTLLRCINLLEHVDEGTIVVDGQTVTGTKVDVNKLRQKVGIVFQSYNLFPHMTVLQNVTLAPRKALGISRDKAQAHARALLRQIGLEDKADEFPTGFRAVSSSASRSCGRSRPGRSCCCSTRSRRRSTRS
jgi:polar amino acid transport system ATP-binding protein